MGEKSIILEYAGVSTMVSGYTEMLVRDCKEKIASMRWTTCGEIKGYNIWSKRLQFNGEEYGNLFSTADITIIGYDPEQAKFYGIVRDFCSGMNYFSIEKRTISCCIPMPINDPEYPETYAYLSGTISHEMLHGLQIMHQGDGKGNLDKDLSLPEEWSGPDYIRYLVNWVAYLLDPNEIGAWVHGCWMEALNSEDITETASWSSLESAEERAKELLNKLRNQYAMSDNDRAFLNKYVHDTFNMSPSRFRQIIAKRLDKLSNAKMKLYNRWMVENGKQTKGGFKRYVRREIPNRIEFNQNPSRLNKIKSWFKNRFKEEKNYTDMKQNKTFIMSEQEINRFVTNTVRRMVREDVLGNNWHEAENTDDMLNNYEPFEDQLNTGDNIHDWSVTGDEAVDPTVYESMKLHKAILESINKVLKEDNELYDEWYQEEDYDGNTGSPGLIRSYDLGTTYTSNLEADAEENGMEFEDYVKYYIDEILPECPWYWSERSGGYYKTLAQWDGIVVKELPGDQIVVDEYPIADAERDRAFQNKLEPGHHTIV